MTQTPASGNQMAAFVAARLDEDEAIARANTGRDGLADDGVGAPMYPDYQTFDGPDLDAANAFIDRFRPTRQLREIEAKRVIVRGITAALPLLPFGEPAYSDALLHIMRTLAAIYSDHPDYDPAWANA